ncbi:MAG: hypothetical protein D3904_14060, partial [Candidatus Electrothrix sp. EH2]|nr:hypothetical protein [Candidatus Electrothrix sp. EH2]
NSDTAAINDSVLEQYRNNARGLLFFLKSIFLLLDNPGELVLQQLAEEPISLHRTQGKKWEEIEGELLSHINPQPTLDKSDYELMKIIELGLLTGIGSKTCWLDAAAEFLQLPDKEIRQRLQNYTNRSPVWQEELGSMVFLR